MKTELNTSKLKSNILISLAIILTLFLTIMISIVIYAQNKGFQNNQDKFHENIHRVIHHTIEHNKKNYNYLLKRVTQTVKIKEFLENEDREALYKIFKPKFDLLKKENKNFTVLNFIKPDGRPLLRVHKKEHYGDDLTSVRPTIRDMITNKKLISGYETGKNATVFRVITPIFKDKKFIGSVGIGINPNYFIEKISELMKEKGFLFIKDKNLKLFSKQSKFTIKDYLLQSDIDKKSLSILKLLPENYNFEDNINIVDGQNNYIIHTHNLIGYDGKDYAKYIFLQNITEALNRQNNTILYLVISLLIFVLLIFITTRYYLNRFSDKVTRFYNKTIEKNKINKKKLQELTKRYEFAINGTQDGLWDWDLVTGDIYFSPQWKKMLGYEDDELKNELKSWESHIHPDDKEHAVKDYTANIEGKTDFYENKHRLKHKDGSWVWILDRGKTIFDENKKAIRMVGFHTDITKEYEANQEIMKLQSAFKRSPISIIMTDLEANITYVNPSWCSITGYKKDEIMGKNPRFLQSGNTTADGYEQMWKALSDGQTWSGDIKNIAKDGSVFWEESTIFPSYDALGNIDGYIGFKLEITKAKEIALKLEENKKIYKDFFEYTKSANIIYHTKDNGETFLVKQLNHLVEELENIKKENVIGKRVDKVFEGIEEFGLLDIFKEVYKTGKPYKMPLTLYKDKNILGWRENYIFKLSNGDIVASYEDKTKEKTLESELKEQEEMMITQSRHAAMGEMISMIAHQWRQPLSVISMGANNIMADVELDMVENESLKNISTEIIDQTQELSKTIDDFKEFFKPIKNSESILIEDVFNNAFGVIGKSLENNDIKIIKKFKSSKKIETYSRELMQVFINILKNAKEALVENKIENKLITISTEDNKDNIHIKISDNGKGIPNEIIPKIFDPYFSTKDEKSGTGLGLYMSKTIIEKHLHGTIEAYNDDNGACFKINLPYDLMGGEEV